MSEQRHITRITDTIANIKTNLDAGQTAIATDAGSANARTEYHVWLENGGNYLYYPAVQKVYSISGATEEFQDNIFHDVIVTSELFVSEYAFHYDDTDTFWRYRDDRLTAEVGSVVMIDMIEDGSQDLVEINPSETDVDFIVNTSSQSNAFVVYGSGGIVVNEDSYDMDFRIEGATDANLLVCNAGLDRVGIGILAPATKLDILLEDAETTTVSNVIKITHTTTGDAQDGFGTGILFAIEDFYTDRLPSGGITSYWSASSSAIAEMAFYVYNSSTANKIITLTANSTTIGAGAAATDYTLTFDGETNDGAITWMEDEDYFQFSDDILMATTERIYFRDSAINVYSANDGYLDLAADTGIRISSALTLSTIAAGTADYDAFLVSHSGVVKYRTGAEVLSDIGAAAVGSISGTENYVAKFGATGATVGNSRIIDDGTHVGIGTAPTDGTLHIITASAGAVAANANYDEIVIESDGAAGISFLGTAIGGSQGIAWGDVDDNLVGWVAYDHGYDQLSIGAGNAAVMYIGADGPLPYVGIGVSDPDAKLEILHAGTQLKLSYDADSFVTFALDTNDDLTVKPAASGGVRFQATADTTDFFQVLDADGGTPIFNVDATNERVGIGTNAPAGKLQIYLGASGQTANVDADDFIIEGGPVANVGMSFLTQNGAANHASGTVSWTCGGGEYAFIEGYTDDGLDLLGEGYLDITANTAIRLSGDIQIGSNYISNDGGSEGISIDASGNVTASDNLVVTGDIYSTAWTDYSGTTEITGWDDDPAPSPAVVMYKKIGKTAIVLFNISGTSTTTGASFTVPAAIANYNSELKVPILRADAGTYGFGSAYMLATGTTVTLYSDAAATGWTASGTKSVRGLLVYETNA